MSVRFTPNETAILNLGRTTEGPDRKRTSRIAGMDIHSLVKAISGIANCENAFYKQNPATNRHKKQLKTFEKYDTLKKRSISIAMQLHERLTYKMNNCGFWGAINGKKIGYQRLITELETAKASLTAQNLPKKPEERTVFETEDEYKSLLGSCGYDAQNLDVIKLITHLSGKELFLKYKAPTTPKETAQVNKLIEGFFEEFGIHYTDTQKQKVSRWPLLIVSRTEKGTREASRPIIGYDEFNQIMRDISTNQLSADAKNYYNLDNEVASPGTPGDQKKLVFAQIADVTGAAPDKIITKLKQGVANFLKKKLLRMINT